MKFEAPKQACKKENCCERAMTAVSKWIKISQGVGNCSDRAVCAYICNNELGYGNLAEITAMIKDGLSAQEQIIEVRQIRASVKRARDSGLLVQTRKFRSRKIGYLVADKVKL